MKHKIVIVDDEKKLLKALTRALEIDGYEVFPFSEAHLGLDFILSRSIDLVISDIRMNAMSGIELLKKVMEKFPQMPCILMTGFSSVETAVTAVKMGVKDYLLKPFELSDFKCAVERALTINSTNSESDSSIIGKTPELKKIHELIKNISDTDSTVLISGESGTGKELIAKSIHFNSKRANSKFVAVNCSAIPETLFESEMFGHIKGSFTNAYIDKDGLFFEAKGGTLFLDEIGDLALASQAKLLRILQDGTYKKVGSNIQETANVRLISATNKNLKDEVKSNNFREDLLYRINLVEIELPALRRRKDDIEELTYYFVNKFVEKHGRNISGIDNSLLKALLAYNWPGNIRQLENCIERAIIMKKSGILTSKDIKLPENDENNFDLDLNAPLQETVEQVELTLLKQALEANKGNHSRAASSLGVTRQSFHYKLKKYSLIED